MSSSQSSPLAPTYIGYIQSTWDALLVFECCVNGLLSYIPRRPHDKERAELIKSGYVFIYEEHSSGIKRWTDSISWSPSRIMNNFLVYRELNCPFTPGEKKKALKRNQRKPSEAGGGLGGSITKKSPSHVDTKPQSTTPLALTVTKNLPIGSTTAFTDPNNIANLADKDLERALIGSLIDSYDFREEGRVKKTISITFQGVQHHLVSYYTIEDVKSGKLMQPSKDPRLQGVWPRVELLMSHNSRMSLDELSYPKPAPAYVTVNYTTNPDGRLSDDGVHSTLSRAIRNRDHPLVVPPSLNGSCYRLHEPSNGEQPKSFMYTNPETLSEQASTNSSGRYPMNFAQQPVAFAYGQRNHTPDYPNPPSLPYQPYQPFSSLSTPLGQDYSLPATSGPQSHGSFSMGEPTSSYISDFSNDEG